MNYVIILTYGTALRNIGTVRPFIDPLAIVFAMAAGPGVRINSTNVV
jgi:hypothetical protein